MIFDNLRTSEYERFFLNITVYMRDWLHGGGQERSYRGHPLSRTTGLLQALASHSVGCSGSNCAVDHWHFWRLFNVIISLFVAGSKNYKFPILFAAHYGLWVKIWIWKIFYELYLKDSNVLFLIDNFFLTLTVVIKNQNENLTNQPAKYDWDINCPV